MEYYHQIRVSLCWRLVLANYFRYTARMVFTDAPADNLTK